MKTIIKNKPAGYSTSQGGIYPVIGYDPQNIKVSLPVSTQKVSGLSGSGIIGDVFSGVAGVGGGIIAGAYTGGNPYLISAGTTLASGSVKALTDMIGLSPIPRHFIDFVDRLIRDGKTLSQIKNSIMSFELSSDLKAKLSRAVSSLLNKMSGGRKVKGRRMKGGASNIFQPNVSAYGVAVF